MQIPQHLPWKSVRPLGSGGQGQVHLVTKHENGSNTKYALKILRKRGSPKARQRFRREIAAIRRVDHPTVVKVLEFAEEHDDFQYYVMKYHEGAQPLDKVIASPSKNPFHGNVCSSLNLFEQIISAIDACQKSETPIVHRDIKPQNILVLKGNKICVIDFGICQLDDGSFITLTDENVGPRFYMAPECGAGNEDSVGAHSDIYSAAKVLWSAITSQLVFDRERPVFENRSMKHMFPTNPNTWHLKHIFTRTIRESPENRIQSAEDAQQLIDEVRYLSQRGFPPLEIVKYRCPSCGMKSLDEFPKAQQVFGEYRLRKAAAFQCTACGFVFLRNTELLQENLTGDREFR